MSSVYIPTVGRIVNYYETEGAPVQAAIVTEGGDLAPCLHVFDKYHGGFIALSIQHKSLAPFGSSYWEWPQVK